jgi:selenide,water dikinase
VLGRLDPGEPPLALAAARPGDRIVLTKPLGTGVILAADMRGLARGGWVLGAQASMLRPNAVAARVARACGATAATDVSGVGLGGHIAELARASGLVAEIELRALPALEGAIGLLSRGVRSTFHAQNARPTNSLELAPAAVRDPALELVFDPQTSGGLIFGVAPGRSAEALQLLHDAGDAQAAVIGKLRARRAGEPAGMLRVDA